MSLRWSESRSLTITLPVDWSGVKDEETRFENLIASPLLKVVHFITDYEGYRAERCKDNLCRKVFIRDYIAALSGPC
jgi:hypothetical protein